MFRSISAWYFSQLCICNVSLPGNHKIIAGSQHSKLFVCCFFHCCFLKELSNFVCVLNNWKQGITVCRIVMKHCCCKVCIYPVAFLFLFLDNRQWIDLKWIYCHRIYTCSLTVTVKSFCLAHIQCYTVYASTVRTSTTWLSSCCVLHTVFLWTCLTLCLVAIFSLRSFGFAAQTLCIPYAKSGSPFIAKKCYVKSFPLSWSQFSSRKL